MAAQTGGIFAGCCGIIVETLCINYQMFNKCCGSCEWAASCCSSCNCGYDNERPSRRSRRQPANAQGEAREGAQARRQEVGPPPYNDLQQSYTHPPSATPPMSSSR
ncbi:hypothetical protein P389DRAFT_57841 [Cystobasidium minutum MCA 4210]|uniref:uncharacterized protein n=1 Tax=Cystobasidium minutum MCA 4210 TaxID=1397322 RepID=UPI0034D01001|eukprot:jgi/Rhomi1/57841/CE57840_555